MTARPVLPLTHLFYRRVTAGDFFNIEKGPAGRASWDPSNADQPERRAEIGQTYFDIPAASRQRLFDMLDPGGGWWADDRWQARQVQVHVAGQPDVIAPLEFRPRYATADNTRYYIARQNRQFYDERHPAWTAARGFPQAPDDIGGVDQVTGIDGLVIYVARSADGRLWAGFVQAPALPPGWPAALAPMFSPAHSADVLEFSVSTDADVPDQVATILQIWKRSPNALLYGPPGTGKTWAMSVLKRLLDGTQAASVPGLEPDSGRFVELAHQVDLPRPIRTEWLTFHQNLSYEDFVLGLRPRPQDGGITLEPRLGTLLDVAEDVRSGACGSAVLFIDELNRGNVSQVFGEFITFLETAYRDATPGDPPNPSRLPVPMPQVDIDGDRTQPIRRPDGRTVQLPVPFYFPRHVYVVASMNSVDRAVAPLDTALARRFKRVPVGPELHTLAGWLGLGDTAGLLARARRGASSDPDAPPAPWTALTARECAWLLLRRLNDALAASFGPDFELGHSYLYSLRLPAFPAEDQAWAELARIWDDAVFPQLSERYAARPDELAEFLRVREGAEQLGGAYLLRLRDGSAADAAVLQRGGLLDHGSSLDAMRSTLRFLCRP